MGRILLETVVAQTKTTPNDSGAIFGWLLALALAVGVGILVSQPLLKLETGKKRVRVRQMSDAQVELETLQDKIAAEKMSLEELEFDKELGILAPNDYGLLKERTANRLRVLESAVFEREEEISEAERERREKVAARRKTPQSAQATQVIEAEEAETTSRATETKRKSTHREALHCSECGTGFKPGDKFCSQCKAPLPLICLNCGAEILEDEAKFCSRCGTTITR